MPSRSMAESKSPLKRPCGAAKPTGSIPACAQHFDAAAEIAEILVQRAIGVVPIGVASHVEPAEPRDGLGMCAISGAVDVVAGAGFVAGDSRERGLEVLRMILVVVDAEVQGAAVRKGIGRHAKPDPAGKLDLRAELLQDLLAEHPLVDPRNCLAEACPAEGPLLPASGDARQGREGIGGPRARSRSTSISTWPGAGRGKAPAANRRARSVPRACPARGLGKGFPLHSASRSPGGTLSSTSGSSDSISGTCVTQNVAKGVSAR